MRAVLQITEKAVLKCEGKIISDCGKGMCNVTLWVYLMAREQFSFRKQIMIKLLRL